MILNMINSLSCEVCGQELSFDYKATLSDYSILLKVNSDNISDKIEKVINKHIVYSCRSCGQIYKHTYKEIEAAMRRQLTANALMLIVREQVLVNSAATIEKFIIYCGKCGGMDGTGCCSKSIFNKCEIKRFPINVF